MREFPRDVIEQSELAQLKFLRAATAEMTITLKRKESVGASVAPGPLNFYRGKLLLHSPVRELLPNSSQATTPELVALLRKLIAASDYEYGVSMGDAWKVMRHRAYRGLCVEYACEVNRLHAIAVAGGRIDYSQAMIDKVKMYLWLGEMRLAASAMGFSARLACRMAEHGLAKIECLLPAYLPVS